MTNEEMGRPRAFVDILWAVVAAAFLSDWIERFLSRPEVEELYREIGKALLDPLRDRVIVTSQSTVAGSHNSISIDRKDYEHVGAMLRDRLNELDGSPTKAPTIHMDFSARAVGT
jgi:hypothetical protein